MRRRLRLRWRMYRPLESYWLVASTDAEWDGGNGPSGMYVDLATGTRSPSFPAHALLALAAQQGAAASKDAPGRGFIAALRVAQEEERRRVRKEKLAASAASAEAPTKPARRAALRARPRCGVELMHAARALKIDLTAQPELGFLAELALCVALPAGWAQLPPLAAGGAPRYRNLVSGIVTTTHPIEAFAAEFRL